MRIFLFNVLRDSLILCLWEKKLLRKHVRNKLKTISFSSTLIPFKFILKSFQIFFVIQFFNLHNFFSLLRARRKTKIIPYNSNYLSAAFATVKTLNFIHKFCVSLSCTRKFFLQLPDGTSLRKIFSFHFLVGGELVLIAFAFVALAISPQIS